mgnify:CR=1 FL=1
MPTLPSIISLGMDMNESQEDEKRSNTILEK